MRNFGHPAVTSHRRPRAIVRSPAVGQLRAIFAAGPHTTRQRGLGLGSTTRPPTRPHAPHAATRSALRATPSTSSPTSPLMPVPPGRSRGANRSTAKRIVPPRADDRARRGAATGALVDDVSRRWSTRRPCSSRARRSFSDSRAVALCSLTRWHCARRDHDALVGRLPRAVSAGVGSAG